MRYRRATSSAPLASPASRRRRGPDLIPLCHPLLVGGIYVNFTIGDNCVEVEAQVETWIAPA